MAETWEFDDFPGLVLIYHGPKTARECYEDVINALKAMGEFGKLGEPKLQDYKDELPGNFIIEAKVDGVFAGNLCVERYEDDVLHFTYLEVEERFQNRGIGRRLTCAGLVKGRELGFSIAKGTVEIDNIPSRKVQGCCGATFSELRISKDDFHTVYYEVKFILNIEQLKGGL